MMDIYLFTSLPGLILKENKIPFLIFISTEAVGKSRIYELGTNK